jgi:hypothetical protein
MDLQDKYIKMSEISRYRQEKRERQQGPQCCKDGDLRLIVAHGSWTDADFVLNPGYKVIMICQPGKPLILNKKKIDELKHIYENGHSFFQNNDTNPDKLTPEAISWFEGVMCPCIARLYQGGQFDLGGGNMVAQQVPNISFEFGGSRVGRGHCDNMDDNSNPTYENNTECRITCIPQGNPVNSDRDFCEKYYFDADSSPIEPDPKFKPWDPHWDSRPSINLETLLDREGPGTYFVVSCMGLGAGKELTEENKQRAEAYRLLSLGSSSARYDPDERRWKSGRPMQTRERTRISKQQLYPRRDDTRRDDPRRDDPRRDDSARDRDDAGGRRRGERTKKRKVRGVDKKHKRKSKKYKRKSKKHKRKSKKHKRKSKKHRR